MLQPQPQPTKPRPATEAARPSVAEQPAQPAVAAQRKPRRWLSLLIQLAVIAALGVGGVVAWPHVKEWLPSRDKSGQKPKTQIVPVVVATTVQTNVDLYLTGLGTATALNTVTVRSRVDGELISVDFDEGQLVQEGDPLAHIDPRQYQVQLAEAKGTIAKDQATLANARADLDRYRNLPARTVTQQQIDLAEAAVKQAAGVIKADQAVIARLELTLSYCEIKAPISGRIGLRTVDRGNLVQANDPAGLCVIRQLQPIAVTFTIPQDDLPRVQKRMATGAPVLTEAWDGNLTTKLATGKVVALDNRVDPSTGTVRIKAQFDNDDDLLFPEQFVNVRLLIDTRKQVIVVPNAAVQRGPSSNYVFVVKDGEKAGEKAVELRTITVGHIEADRTIVDKGLQPGEIVVVEGIDKLQNKSKVTVPQAGSPAERAGLPAEKAGPPANELRPPAKRPEAPE